MMYIEISFLLCAMLIVLSILWSTLRTGISPMMSSGKARSAMLDALNSISQTTEGPLVDLGSGWGTLVVALARKYPKHQVIGYELSWLPWLISQIRKHSLGLNNLTIYRKDFMNADFNCASVLFCYLFPGAMAAIEKKLKTDVSHNILIISNTFSLPNCQPAKIVKLNDFYRSPIYVYEWQEETLDKNK